MLFFVGAGGSDLSLTYPQQIQLFSRLDTANVLSLENAFNFFFFHFSMLCLQLYICL